MTKKTGKTATRPETELAASPSHLLHCVLQRANGIYAEEVGDAGLTQRQYALLAAVRSLDQPSQTDLVNLTGIDRSTLAELVARLIEKGWLARVRSASDGRAKTVGLTEAGTQILETVRPRVRAADKRILALLAKPKRETLIKLLTRLAETPEAEPKRKKKTKVEGDAGSGAVA
jgi:DNA-binding MarR family transcriptional regulator